MDMNSVDTTRDDQPRNADDENEFVRFLDLAGHDLRNPITVLKSQVQLLQRRLAREEGRDEDLRELGRMAYQIERLNVGLDTFVEAARIRQGRFQLMPDECDLSKVMRRLAAIYETASRAHTVTIETPDEPIIANWDTTRVELVLAALLTNALKFTTQGDVMVAVTREPPLARIAVTDSGPGIPAGEEATIFDEYVTSSSIENSGVGLGLFVAREIVREHGGDIGVTTPQSGGASFWFTLPLAGVPGTVSSNG